MIPLFRDDPAYVRALYLLGCGSALALLLALVSQYGYGLHPCELCLKQRYPYVGIVLLAAAGITARRYAKWLLVFAVLILLGEAAIAFYHVGVEQGWWESGCSGSTAGDVNELRDRILNAPLVRCDQPAFTFLNLSMAAWNTLYALALATFGSVVLYWQRQKTRG